MYCLSPCWSVQILWPLPLLGSCCFLSAFPPKIGTPLKSRHCIYCKPSFIHDDFTSQFTKKNWFVATMFHVQDVDHRKTI